MEPMKLELGVFLDDDGHFRVVPLHDRTKMIETLKTFDGGDFWQNAVVAEGNDTIALRTIPENHWEMFLGNLTQRGIFEIINL